MGAVVHACPYYARSPPTAPTNSSPSANAEPTAHRLPTWSPRPGRLRLACHPAGVSLPPTRRNGGAQRLRVEGDGVGIPLAIDPGRLGHRPPARTSIRERFIQRRKDTSMRTLVAALVMIAVSFWGPATRAADYPADNSGKNVRDRQESSKTPGDQSNSKADVAITQAIRKAVVADKALSTKAHNVKIITADGVVTLRGPVNSSEEKDKIAAKDKSVAGVKRVENKLELGSR